MNHKIHHPECAKFLVDERIRLSALGVVDEAYVQTQCVCDIVAEESAFLAGRDTGDETDA